MHSDVLKIPAEQPYDSIPNFSAADALRLTGIGRNEFIDIMNKCRSKVVLLLFIVIVMLSESRRHYLVIAHACTCFRHVFLLKQLFFYL